MVNFFASLVKIGGNKCFDSYAAIIISVLSSNYFKQFCMTRMYHQGKFLCLNFFALLRTFADVW